MHTSNVYTDIHHLSKRVSPVSVSTEDNRNRQRYISYLFMVYIFDQFLSNIQYSNKYLKEQRNLVICKCTVYRSIHFITFQMSNVKFFKLIVFLLCYLFLILTCLLQAYYKVKRKSREKKN